MALRFCLRKQSTSSTGNPPSLMTHWGVYDCPNRTTAEATIIAGTPAVTATIWGTLYRQDIQVTHTGHRQYHCDVPYAVRKHVTGDYTWDFDTTGGTIHITQGEEVGRYPAATAPDQKGVIGVEDDRVVGTEKVIPAMKINISFRHPSGVITIPKAKFVSNITGTVNSTPFLTFAPGEVLFLGGRGRDGSATEATVDYSFAMSANITGLSIGDIAGIEHKGWNTSWIRYKDSVIGANADKVGTKVPQHVYVNRIYEEIDLAGALGFGA